MRKVYLLTAILLLSTVWVVAQTTPSTTQQPSTPTQTSPSTTSPSQSSPSTTTQTTTETTQTSTSSSSIEGCLSGSAGNFTLTDTAGKTWQLAGDTSKLSDHVGHQVRITGSEAGGSAGSMGGGSTSPSSNPSNPSAPSSGAGAGAGSSASGGAGSSGSQPTFTVNKVKMISSSCPSPSK